MAEQHQQLDAIEHALLELEVAEQARMFDHTRFDSEEALADGAFARPSREWQRPMRWLSAAAMVAMFVGGGTWMFQASRTPLAMSPPGAGTNDVFNVDEGCGGSPLDCFTTFASGPDKLALADCRCTDYDADGHVDLSDFRVYQLNFERIAYKR